MIKIKYLLPNTKKIQRVMLIASLLLVFLASCSPPAPVFEDLVVEVSADDVSRNITVEAGTTVMEAYEIAGIIVGENDRSEPPFFTVLSAGIQVQLFRVQEEYEIIEESIPFETQTIQNETLPDGETRLIQAGENGLKEVTYRKVFEDGIEISNGVIKVNIINEAVPEIYMIGTQAAFTAIEIPGMMVYVSDGNAWLMEGTTGSRIPIVTSNDLDGSVLLLSPNQEWLLYTRTSTEEDEINQLWVSQISDPGNAIDLGVRNIIHFADWMEGSSNYIIYTSAKVNDSQLGWEALNDVSYINFSTDGVVPAPRKIVEDNSGSVFGWWGMEFKYGTDLESLYFARPDSIGLVDYQENDYSLIHTFTPYYTRADWAWLPPFAIDPLGQYLYYIDHVSDGSGGALEDSQGYDLVARNLEAGIAITLKQGMGMFSSLAVSPLYFSGSEYKLALLVPDIPLHSIDSAYRLAVMDRDGSNYQIIFPLDGQSGIQPQDLKWAPDFKAKYGKLIAVVFQGNLWIIDSESGTANQITADGRVTTVEWK